MPYTTNYTTVALCMQFHKQLKQLVNRAATHPKMAALLEVVLDHFQPQGAPPQPDAAVAARPLMLSPTAADAEAVGDMAAIDQPGRVIIFTNRRDSVQSIVEMLRTRDPVITARWVVAELAGLVSPTKQAPRNRDALLLGSSNISWAVHSACC